MYLLFVYLFIISYLLYFFNIFLYITWYFYSSYCIFPLLTFYMLYLSTQTFYLQTGKYPPFVVTVKIFHFNQYWCLLQSTLPPLEGTTLFQWCFSRKHSLNSYFLDVCVHFIYIFITYQANSDKAQYFQLNTNTTSLPATIKSWPHFLWFLDVFQTKKKNIWGCKKKSRQTLWSTY